MIKNPWFTLVIGLMVGLALGFVLAERQAILDDLEEAVSEGDSRSVEQAATRLRNSLGTVAACAVALLLFYLLIRHTKLGVAMRATASDQEVALTQGIPVGRVFAVTWFLAAAFAALAGIFLAMFPKQVNSNLGFVALRAFPAVIVGGLDSAWGTVLAGLMLGVLEVLCEGYVNEHLGQFGHGFHTVFPYVVMVIFLVFRPYGLFGTREVERV